MLLDENKNYNNYNYSNKTETAQRACNYKEQPIRFPNLCCSRSQYFTSIGLGDVLTDPVYSLIQSHIFIFQIQLTELQLNFFFANKQCNTPNWIARKIKFPSTPLFGLRIQIFGLRVASVQSTSKCSFQSCNKFISY